MRAVRCTPSSMLADERMCTARCAPCVAAGSAFNVEWLHAARDATGANCSVCAADCADAVPSLTLLVGCASPFARECVGRCGNCIRDPTGVDAYRQPCATSCAACAGAVSACLGAQGCAAPSAVACIRRCAPCDAGAPTDADGTPCGIAGCDGKQTAAPFILDGLTRPPPSIGRR